MPDTTLATRNAWDKRDDETDHSYAAFRQYLQLPRFGPKGQRRSHVVLAKQLGHNATTTVEHWSSRYDWTARVNAYEMSQPALPEVYAEQSITDYRETVITKSTQVASALWEILGHELERIRRDQLTENRSVPIADLQKLAKTAQAIQEMARQSAGLPRDYGIVETMDEEDENAPRAVVVMGDLTDTDEDAEV
jgi:hypothetical protein